MLKIDIYSNQNGELIKKQIEDCIRGDPYFLNAPITQHYSNENNTIVKLISEDFNPKIRILLKQLQRAGINAEYDITNKQKECIPHKKQD